MATLEEFRNSRLNKLDKLRDLGVNPYPAKSFKDINNSEILQDFEKFEGKDVVISGRITSLRKHGKLVFIDIKDSTGKIQLFIKEEVLKEADHKSSELDFKDLELLDSGDFAEGFGKVIKTQTGEISVSVETLRILGKSIRPMPDMWDGLKDKEVRLRRRYLDTNINKEVYDRFIRRAKFWETHREFFKENGFIEMNIPVLEQTPGGADAKPFVTHMDAIDQDLYLRISQELYLKRLIGGGYSKVFEIGPRFRNEGLSDEHLPEHMAMELYWAYANWEEGMEFVKKLFEKIFDKVYDGRRTFKIRGFNVDFSKGWKVIDFAEVMKEKFGIDVFKTNYSEIEKACKDHEMRNEIGRASCRERV